LSIEDNFNTSCLKQKEQHIKALMEIPGVGKSIANDLLQIGILSISDLKNKDPEILYALSNERVGATQDRCLLYVFRCAVYYAETEKKNRRTEKLKWWNWKDDKLSS
jgi:ERCC4-type nuclease